MDNLNTLSIALQVEAATIEAVKGKQAYTVVGFEPDGDMVAFINGEFGSYWITL